MAFDVKISSPTQKNRLKGLILLGKDHPMSLNVIGLEPRKRVMTIDDLDVTVWPVHEFLTALWEGKVWAWRVVHMSPKL